MKHKTIPQLLICTMIGFSVISAIYSAKGGSLSSRWQFAIVMSVMPAGLARAIGLLFWVFFGSTTLKRYAWAVYFTLFGLLLVLQGC